MIVLKTYANTCNQDREMEKGRKGASYTEKYKRIRPRCSIDRSELR